MNEDRLELYVDMKSPTKPSELTGGKPMRIRDTKPKRNEAKQKAKRKASRKARKGKK